MKKILFAYFLIVFTVTVFAQSQTNNWYFGVGIGLDFNFTPPKVLTNNTANAQEGSASISDNNGKLLFYTNGLVVINRKHEVMLNGGSLRGDLSSTSNTIIVPLPGNDSIYYLFTIGATGQLNKLFRYNVINIKGDGGFGEVVQKNVFIEEAYEKLAAVRHCNNKDVWLVIRKWESDEYQSFLLTSSGISSPVISHTGLTIGGVANNAIGTLKFSLDGKRLAAVHSTENDVVELMNFDNTTGVISNPVIFSPNSSGHQLSYTGSYSAEFSPNGNLLYVSSSNSVAIPSALYQFDITSGVAGNIIASKQVIAAPAGPWFSGALQTGPDMKIYMAMWRDTALSVIENPDIYGPGCNFQLDKISFGNRVEPVQFGLPSFIQSDLSLNFAPFNFTRAGKCDERNVQFNLNRTSGVDSVKWDFGDGQQSQSFTPNHLYSSSGFYTVTLIVYKVDCSNVNDTIKKDIWIADNTDLLSADTTSCDFADLNLGVKLNMPGQNYLWSTGKTTDNIVVTSPGKYWVQIEFNGCKLSDTINVSVKAKPIVYAGPDTSICSNKQILLYSGNATANTFLWNTGETSSSIAVNKAGTYFVTVTENACTASDTVIVFPGDCDIFIPNTFTPNDDGVNDKFGIANIVAVQDFSMKIYNRYGQVVFSTGNVNEKWDGKYKGKNVPIGTYSWSIVYINGKGYTKWLKGAVLVLH